MKVNVGWVYLTHFPPLILHFYKNLFQPPVQRPPLDRLLSPTSSFHFAGIGRGVRPPSADAPITSAQFVYFVYNRWFFRGDTVCSQPIGTGDDTLGGFSLRYEDPKLRLEEKCIYIF